MNTPLPLLLVYVVLPAAFLIFLGYSLYCKKRQSDRLFNNGIDYIKTLRGLLAAIQQHRGLTTGFINGNRDAKTDIEKLSARILREVRDLHERSDWVSGNVKWNSLNDHWQRLSSAYLQGDADNNFKQHNILIANLLYLIEDLADAHHLSKMGGGSLDTDWRYLLSIAEYIGQARALGTGVAARGECNSVMRIQLNHLRNKIAGAIAVNWPEPSRKEISNLLQTIEEKLIVDMPTIGPRDFFDLATRCIDHVLEQFDQQIDNLQFARR